MRKVIYILLAILIMACDDQEFNIDNSNAFIAFENHSESIVIGNDELLKVPVYMTSNSGLNAEATFEINTDNIDPKYYGQEGVDFEILNANKTLKFENGFTDSIVIKPLINLDDILKFNLKLVSNTGNIKIGLDENLGTSSLVTIYPEKYVYLGMYTCDAIIDEKLGVLYPGMYTDQQWAIEIKVSEDNDDQLVLTGFYGSSDKLLVDFDHETEDFEIVPNQKLSTVSNLGPSSFIYASWTDEQLIMDEEKPLKMNYKNGEFTIEKCAVVCIEGPYAGYVDNYYSKMIFRK